MAINNLSLKCLLSISILIFIASEASLVGCAERDKAWHLDAEYSQQLTIDAGMSGRLIAETVDEVRIYKISSSNRDMFDLAALYNEELVFKTKEGEIIKKLLVAAQDIIMNMPECYSSRKNYTLHIAALDNELRRVGYFLLSPCVVEGGYYGMITPLNSRNIYYNKELIPIFEEIGIWKKLKRLVNNL